MDFTAEVPLAAVEPAPVDVELTVIEVGKVVCCLLGVRFGRVADLGVAFGVLAAPFG